MKGSENNGIIPPAYGNAELMKIPNFLHLTPNHIKKQCAAIKSILNVSIYCSTDQTFMLYLVFCWQNFVLHGQKN